jgi:hypothetical protein
VPVEGLVREIGMKRVALGQETFGKGPVVANVCEHEKGPMRTSALPFSIRFLAQLRPCRRFEVRSIGSGGRSNGRGPLWRLDSGWGSRVAGMSGSPVKPRQVHVV